MAKPRVQAIVVRGERILMVKHRQNGVEWWCIPGGGLEEGETSAQGALRELMEECNVHGRVLRQTSHLYMPDGNDAISFLVDIGEQEPALGHDPDVAHGEDILADVRWLSLREIPERDRIFLWAAGLVGVPGFWAEIELWDNDISYPTSA